MRILFLTQYYPPETGAAPLRAYHFATKLAKRGHDVTVVTGMPNHPSGVVRPEYRRRLALAEERDGVRILRRVLFATPNRTFLTRMLNHLSFMVTSFFGGLSAGRCDVVLVSSPPLFLGLSAWLLGLVKRVPFVLDVRDYWPHAAVALGQLRSATVITLATRMERFLYRRSASLVAVTPGMRRLMLERGIPEHRICLITNGADVECFTPSTDRTALRNGKATVLYSGTHGLVHGMEVILDAAELLLDDDRIRFLLVGDGVAKPTLVNDARDRSLSNVKFSPSLQPTDLAVLIREADVCLASTTSGAFSAGTIPVKVFDYMACARPVVAAVAGDAKAVIEESGGGIAVEPGDARSFADAIKAFVDDPERGSECGARGREYVCSKFSRERLSQRLDEVLSAVVSAESALGSDDSRRVRRYLVLKYSLDVVFSLFFLVVTSPLFLLLAILIKIDSPGRSIFNQRRIGVYSEEFMISKFRTMDQLTPDLATDIMVDQPTSYTTRMGRFLRATSLDEMPNFWNILRGEMSVVGPRPALYNQSELIEMRRRLGVDVVRPGLTGWAQINGRDSVTLDEKVRLDEFYVRNCSFLLDLKILLRTAGAMSNPDDLLTRPTDKDGGSD